ncbi:oxidative stress-induced growth inhibitor 2 [Cephus cinctus]|uniref:Oxidative stress-induced growth inhibitor 2 n=1 Tax=Cephus cinctus TaxID=211228 RepID=A0AAJ7C4W2_CEPCN|nr:oxidative stress-induced growth inhibitor 2 [Cephus cinctus]
MIQDNDCGTREMDEIYKEVVIVGNGPSGICLSYMLAGNWPYYTGEPHPGDEMLTARLHFSTRAASTDNILENDGGDGGTLGRSCKRDKIGLAHSTRCGLECLSSGLEGRSGGRPLALLMDQLQHPCVDAGLDLPSLLTWKSVEDHPEHKIIDHVVLGKGPPGGAWQSMDPNVLTISLSRWMSLPGLDLRKWEQLIESEQTDKCHSQEKASCKAASRVSVGTVAAYYKDYVLRQGLQKYFRSGTTVTSAKPVSTENEGETEWIVEGFENETGKKFRYRCRRLVLATGTTDSSNRLGIPGEESETSWVTHDLNDLESRLDLLAKEFSVDPVLVVGAGLSAADAVIAARFRGIPVLHAFRDSSGDSWRKDNDEDAGIKLGGSGYDRLQWLPASIYPEYHKVYEMMADGGTNYPLYKALPGYNLVELGNSSNKTVTLCAPNGRLETYCVSVAAILIGSKPDLSYLENGGLGLGKNPIKPVDSRSNPIEIDNYTYEVTQAPGKNLYAMGPLVGDNFVRFVLGGAFGILTHILHTSNT